MIRFSSDYQEGACDKIMQRLMKTNMEQTCGYGEDIYCKQAGNRIRRMCDMPDAQVHFLVGGTQVNTLAVAAYLKPYQGVICADTGHIAVHETGAIESTGHKVLTVPHQAGKLTALEVRALVTAHRNDPSHEHTVQPAMVYVSFPTEFGTLYSKKELTELYDTCKELSLMLYIDGARLGYGLMSPECDLSMEELAHLCDMFTIGGTKVGALFGEALVLCNPCLFTDYRYYIKQRGGMLAKGRLLGIQFLALLEDDTYYTLARNAVSKAMALRQLFIELHVPMLIDSPTNQQFPILSNAAIRKLSENYVFETWKEVDAARTAVRICTSWATTDDQLSQLMTDLRACC